MSDIDFHVETIVKSNSWAIEILEDCEKGKLKLPPNSFVFSMRLGEQFMFFNADGQFENPPIYFYYERRGKFEKIANSLWEVIERELALQEGIRKEHPEIPLWKSHPPE
jgi:hypothetical protein